MIEIDDSQKGFTLVEILIALFIFAMVATLSLLGLKNVVDSQKVIESHVAQLHEMELSQLLLQRDFSQLIDRPITDEDNQLQPSVYGKNDFIEFTKAGYINPLAMDDRSELQRVAYYLKNNQLIRQSWAQLDRTQNTPVIEKVLMNNVLKIQFRYLDNKGVFHDKWPTPGTPITTRSINVDQQQSTNQSNLNQQPTTTTSNPDNANQQQTQTSTNTTNPATLPPPPTIPTAIEMIITIDKVGQLDRVFAIPGVGLNG